MPQSPLPPADPPPDSSSESRQAPPAPIAAAQDHLPAHTDAEIATARGYVDASRAPGTRKAYAADWRRFTAWCHARHTQGPSKTPDVREAPAPPTLPASPAPVAIYLAALAAQGKAPPSIGRALAALAHANKRTGEVPPHRAADGDITSQLLAAVQDEARVGQKGRCCRRWCCAVSGRVGGRSALHLRLRFAAVELHTRRDFYLVLPAVSTEAISAFLHHFSPTLNEDEHAAMVIESAGWHTSHDLGRAA